MRKKNESRSYLIQIETKMKKSLPQTTQTTRRRSRQCRRLFIYTYTRVRVYENVPAAPVAVSAVGVCGVSCLYIYTYTRRYVY